MAWQYSDGNASNGGFKCRWGRQKSRFWAYIWIYCVLSKLQPASCYQHATTGPRSGKLWHLLLVVSGGFVDVRSLRRNVYDKKSQCLPKTTEQYLISHSDKSVAYVINNKRLLNVLYYCDKHEASHGLVATAELLVTFAKVEVMQSVQFVIHSVCHSVCRITAEVISRFHWNGVIIYLPIRRTYVQKNLILVMIQSRIRIPDHFSRIPDHFSTSITIAE